MTETNNTTVQVKQRTLKSHFTKLRESAEILGITAFISLLVSAGVSGFALVYFTARMEESKEHVVEVMKQKEQFDNSQNKLFIELMQYTNRIFDNAETNKAELQAAIVVAQLQLNRLRDDLAPADREILKNYSDELENLLKALRTTAKPSDLKPILTSAQKVLELHDKVAERVKGSLKITVF